MITLSTVRTAARRPVTAAAGALALALALAACGGSGAASNTPAGGGLVRTVNNTKLGAHVLVNSDGMTLYALSAERGGRFICTRGSTVPGGSASCLSLWRPLTVPATATPSGAVGSLATIKRPDGAGTQVTYQGQPLYTFTGDHRRGDASGNGFKDVGTWQAVTVGGTASSTPAATGYGGAGY